MNAFAAFPLIADKLPEYCSKLCSFPATEFWVHETVLSRYLNLPRGPKHGQSEALTALIACIKKGKDGDKRKGTFVSTSIPATDLSTESNSLGVSFQKWGDREEFQCGTLQNDTICRSPRWFKFGNKCVIELKEQYEIARELVGEDTAGMPLPKQVSKQRKESYANFFNQTHGITSYSNFDIPRIAFRFRDLWGVHLVEDKEGTTTEEALVRRSSFSEADLLLIESDLRKILAYCNVIGRIGVTARDEVVLLRTREVLEDSQPSPPV